MAVPILSLAQSQYARRVHEFLDASGLKLSLMHLYRRDIPAEADNLRRDGKTHPNGVSFDVFRAADLAPEKYPHSGFEALDPTDHVLFARADDEVVGWTFLTHGKPAYVQPVETTLRFRGLYIWNLWVDPEYRQGGIASALINEGLRFGRSALDAERAFAIVSVLNGPSKSVFEGRDFDPVRKAVYCRVADTEWRSSLLRSSA
ncbi:GNAT family N-acetyltransferase [Haloarchaeobius sp. DFWS5]|uniref:GNAT family N-acetyltransferase n=1 Tax=Haloarchaeobius sp. DFWS5 TaxID=3446114 RepID=UPI003EBA0E24